ncbi:basic proline-rich protein-like [Sinocyclocheilus rhinocerous]|uniref:basic proline-rich protein-like n=1 Tax=Sinocyclocheilus rhinocerous TaxID=307959 RepID=UPI0007B89DB4|nr:PREDICTED: basic proline-rich protein-like [Sinocyclocheilus rhinocerous]
MEYESTSASLNGGPDLAPPPAGLQPENQPPPVQPVMNPSVPINAVPYMIQPYKGYPVQRYLPNAIPQTAGPGPVPLAAGLEPQNQPLPVQPVMNLPGPSNPVPHQVQSYTGYPIQNYPPSAIPQTAGPGPVPPAAGPHQVQSYTGYPIQNYPPSAIPQTAGPGPVPPAAGLEPQNQPLLVQTVMNLPGPSNPVPHQVQSYTVGYPIQNYPPSAIPQTAGPGPVPPAAGLEPQNQPLLVQTVMNLPGPSNPVPHQVQSYTVGYPIQNYPPSAIPQTAGPGPVPPAAGLEPQNQPLLVQTVMNLPGPSNPVPHQVQSYTVGYPIQNYPPSAIPQTAGPGPVPLAAGLEPQNQPLLVQTVMNLPGPSNPVPHQVQSYTVGYPIQNYPPSAIPQTAGPGPVPPAAGLEPQNQPLLVQTVMNLPGPSNPVPHQVQSYTVGYPIQNYPPSAIPQTAGPGPVPPAAGLEPQNQPLLVQTVMNLPGPSNPVPHQVQSYTVGYPIQNYPPSAIPQTAGPGPVPPAAGLEPQNQPLLVQTVMNLPGPSNPVPHQVQSYTVGYPIQNYPPSAIPQTAGPGPVPPAAGLEPQNQPLLVQTVMNLPGPSNPVPHQVQSYTVGYPIQNYPPSAIPQTAGPGPVPPAAGLEPQNQPLLVQTVMNLPGPSNPVPHQVQSYTVGYPIQNYLPSTIPQTAGPGPVPPAAGLEPQNQPLPVQTVMNPSSPSNSAPHQVQSYTDY